MAAVQTGRWNAAKVRAIMKVEWGSNRSGMQVIRCLTLGAALCLPLIVAAQTPAGAGSGNTTLPDSPQPKQQDDSNGMRGTTPKFIGYISSKSIAFPDIATGPGPLSTGGKFKLFVNQSISPAYLLAAGVSAAYSQARDVPSAYGQGWNAYGNRYGATLTRASTNSFFSTFLLATAFHHDPRFFPESHPTLWGAMKYSAEKIVVSRNDAGNQVVNSSGLLGPLLAESLANAYLPASQQTAGKTFERYGTDTAWKFAANMFKDYWPTIFRKYRLNRLVVLPTPPPPGTPQG
jgi:hypothetical protein